VIGVRLKAIRRLAKVYKHKVMVLEDWNGSSITINGLQLIKGSQDELPYWLASVLERKNIVKIEEEVSIEDLGRILFQEKQSANTSASLIPLSKDFFFKVKSYIDILNRENNIDNIDKIRKTRNILNEIYKIRSRKVMQLAFLEIEDQNLINNMTEEELLIYNTIKELIKELYGDIIGNT